MSRGKGRKKLTLSSTHPSHVCQRFLNLQELKIRVHEVDLDLLVSLDLAHELHFRHLLHVPADTQNE